MEQKSSKRLGRKRLAVDIPDHLFELLRKVTFDQRTTITRYVINAIVFRLKLEGSDEKTK